MAKRVAGTELNHDNWDQEEEPEDPGTFEQADSTSISARKIVRAKRRGGDRASKPIGEGLFSGFGGFTKGAAAFKTNEDANAAIGVKPSTGSTTNFGFGTITSSNTSTTTDAAKLAHIKGDHNLGAGLPADENDRSLFLGALKALNESFVGWLDKNVKQNAFCYLTPVFSDYTSHVEKIKSKYNCGTSKPTPATAMGPATVGDSPIRSTGSIFSTATDTLKSSAELSKPLFSIGSKTSPLLSAPSPPSKPTFSFGAPSSSDKRPPTESGKQLLGSHLLFGSAAKSSSEDKPQEASQPIFSFKKGETASPTKKDDSSDLEPAEPGKQLLGSHLLFGSAAKSSSEDKPQDPAAPKPLFSFGSPNTSPPDIKSNSLSTTTPAGGIMFGRASTATAPTFSFGGGGGFKFGSNNNNSTVSTSVTAAPTFSFGSGATMSTGFSFGKTSAAPGIGAGADFFKDAVSGAKLAVSEQSSGATNEEAYEPPKAVVEKEIVEEDSLFTKRVKLFYEKEGQYVDRGIGNLFIKPLDSGKNSVLIRADTNLGNILLNIVLTESMPVARVGKNNVSMVCVVNPQISDKEPSDKLYTLLIRVKNSEDADELKDKLIEYQK